MPQDGKTAVAIARGHAFHRFVERHFLGIPTAETEIEDCVLRSWWRSFMSSSLSMANGRAWPEQQLTIPAGQHLLNGRFDLVVVSSTPEGAAAHLFDWKTSRPRSAANLRLDWQTRLYLAMLAQSGTALTGMLPPLTPSALQMTYWYTVEPDSPRTIQYSQAAHEESWAEIIRLTDRISTYQRDESWPLTADLPHCRHCPYQVYCGRQTAGQQPEAVVEESAAEQLDTLFLEARTP